MAQSIQRLKTELKICKQKKFTIHIVTSSNSRELTRLRVELSELPSSVLNEVEAYPWNMLLSDIGGSAGLILGISALTIFLQIEGTAFAKN